MVSEEESKQSPHDTKHPSKQPNSTRNKDGTIFSPRLKSAAALAGWDEEALLIASLVVEDTPDRQSKQKKRTDLYFKTPPSSSRRKRRAQRTTRISVPVAVLDMSDEETVNVKEGSGKKKVATDTVSEKPKKGQEEVIEKRGGISSSCAALPSMDRLREELSCAICLEICFEPSTTPCGHSFCKKCLRSAADKCGKKCPKCRQLISNGRSCTINTVLWNTIQLLFPEEIEARKASGVSRGGEVDKQSPQSNSQNRNLRLTTRALSRSTFARTRSGLRSQGEEVELEVRSLQRDNEHVPQVSNHTRIIRPSSGVSSRDEIGRRRRGIPSQDQDAALAQRLQREEFMVAFRGTTDQSGNSVSVARANLRAMASRAMDIRIRGRHR